MHNYQKEEEPRETPETLVANQQAQISALDGVLPQTAEALNRVEQNLGWLNQLPGVQENPDAQNAITYVFQDAQDMATQIARMDAARLAANAFTTKMWKLHRELAGEYEDLENAVVDMDRSHPLIDRMMDDIEIGIHEEMEDYIADAGYQEGQYDMIIEFQTRLCAITGSDDIGAINRLSNLFLGDPRAFTPEQRHLMNQLLHTVSEPEATYAEPQ